MDLLGSLLNMGGSSGGSGRLLGASHETLFSECKSKVEKEFNTKIFMLYQGTESSWMSSFKGSETITWKEAKSFIDFLRDDVENGMASEDSEPCNESDPSKQLENVVKFFQKAQEG